MGKEKGILIGFVYVAFLLAIFYFFKVIMAVIPGMFVIALAIVFLYFYIIPTFSKQFYTYSNCSDYVNFTRFVPIYNQVMLFTPKLAIVYMINAVLLIVSIIMLFVKPSVVTFLGANIAYGWGNGWVVIMLLLLLTFSIVQGLGYIELTTEINRGVKKVTGIGKDRMADKAILAIEYILLFVPIFRSISLMFQLSLLTKLVEFEHVTQGSLDKLADGNYANTEAYYDDEDER